MAFTNDGGDYCKGVGGVLAIRVEPRGQTRWRSFDAAILDVKLERISGPKVLERIKVHDETIQVLILAGAEKERFETALAALRMGAHDFLMKPIRNIQDLLALVDRAVEKRRLAYNLKQLAHSLEQMSNTDTLTGLSNRRHFFDWLSQEFLRTKRYRRPIGCMLIAIDQGGGLGRLRTVHRTEYRPAWQENPRGPRRSGWFAPGIDVAVVHPPGHLHETFPVRQASVDISGHP